MRSLLDCIHGYDRIQSIAVALLYIQVACALIGSLGALYTGVLLANLAIAFFALVAIESGSQTLGRTYVALLACALLLDVCWFIFFSYEIRQFDRSEQIGKFSLFSLELVLWMEIAGFCVRAFSAFVWLQMYRLGPSFEPAYYRTLAAADQPGSSENTPTTVRQASGNDEALGGSIYDPTYYSSIFRFQEKESSSGSKSDQTGPTFLPRRCEEA